MNNKRFIVSMIYIIIGVIFIAISVYGTADEFWSSMGSTMIIIGILHMVRQIRYKTDEEYREKYDIERKDERNRFLANKAWAWAGYLFVLIAAVGSIILKIVGYEDLMMMASGSVCLIVLLYWVSYMVLKKKY